jgi:hypothetical protein
MSGILTGVKPIKMANGGLVPSGGLPYGNPQGTLGGYGGMGLGTGSGYAEGGDVDYKELAKGIGGGILDFVDPTDPINALLYALWLFPPAGAAATAGKLAYAGGKGIKAIRTAKKAKRLSKLAPELTGKKGYDLGHKATAGGLGAYFGKELVEAAPDLYEIAETAVTDPEIIMEIIKESVPRKAEGGLLEAPVLYAAKGKVVKKKAKTVAQKVKEKKKKADADKKKKADEAKQKKADEKAKKDREEAEKKRAEEQKTADEKIRKEEEIALKNRSGYQKFTDWRKGLPWYGRFPLYPPLAVGAAGWIGKRQLDKRAVKREAEEKRKQLVEQIETAQAKATDVDAQAEREATSAEKRRRNRALIAAGREMTKYTEGYVPYNWLSDAATAYSDTMAGKDEPELIQTAYAMMAENPELKFEDALRSVLSRGAVGAVDPELQEIQMMQSIPGLEETAEFLLQQYYLTRLSPEALSRVSEAATEIE